VQQRLPLARHQKTRRILHQNVNAHPTAEWTLQPFWEALAGDDRYRFVIHDRDSIFSKGLDQAVNDLGVEFSERRCGHRGKLCM
jgi:hypothetical protein